MESAMNHWQKNLTYPRKRLKRSSTNGEVKYINI